MKAERIEKTEQSNENVDRRALAQRLKEAREYLELSQDEIARVLEVPRTAISLIESGQRKVEAIELKNLAQLYQRPVGFFTGDDVVPKPVPESVEHLARAATELSDQDREELLRFARFLQTRDR